MGCAQSCSYCNLASSDNRRLYKVTGCNIEVDFPGNSEKWNIDNYDSIKRDYICQACILEKLDSGKLYISDERTGIEIKLESKCSICEHKPRSIGAIMNRMEIYPVGLVGNPTLNKFYKLPSELKDCIRCYREWCCNEHFDEKMPFLKMECYSCKTPMSIGSLKNAVRIKDTTSVASDSKEHSTSNNYIGHLSTECLIHTEKNPMAFTTVDSSSAWHPVHTILCKCCAGNYEANSLLSTGRVFLYGWPFANKIK